MQLIGAFQENVRFFGAIGAKPPERAAGAGAIALDAVQNTLVQTVEVTGTTFSVDSTIQRRVETGCPSADQAIKTINADGTVTCETDDDCDPPATTCQLGICLEPDGSIPIEHAMELVVERGVASPFTAVAGQVAGDTSTQAGAGEDAADGPARHDLAQLRLHPSLATIFEKMAAAGRKR